MSASKTKLSLLEREIKFTARQIRGLRRELAARLVERDDWVEKALDIGATERDVAGWADLSPARVHQIKDESKEPSSG